MKPLSVLIAGVIVSVWVSAAEGQTAPFTLSYTEGLVTLRATNAPLAEIFESLVSKGIVEVMGMDRLTGLVTLEVTKRPVDAAVTELLADYNFVVTTPKAVAGKPAPAPRVRIHSLRDPSAVVQGPISIPELRALRADELLADLPEPVDPDADEDERKEAEEAAQEQADEEAERIAALTDQERAGAFDRKVPVNALGEMLEDDNPLIRARALTELNARTGPEALGFVLRGLEDEDASVRYQAVDLLSRRTDSTSLERLGALLVGGTDNSVRYGAFMVLAARPDTTSVAFVERVANDADAIIQAAAATFLREMARRAATPGSAPSKPPGDTE